VHSLHVDKVVDAYEDAPRVRQVTTGPRSKLKQILGTDLLHLVQILYDRRFYQKSIEIEFNIIDQYFRERGFQFSRGMSLMPSRRVLAKFEALNTILHPREKIHVVAPGDPMFQMGGVGDSNSNVTESRSPWVRSGSNSGVSMPSAVASKAPTLGAGGTPPGYAHDPPSRPGGIRHPRLLITSQRLLVFQDDHWVSHFYSDMMDELPSILSWCEQSGWHRALDNEGAQYFRCVRYVSVNRKRITLACTDTNTAALASWLLNNVCERNDKVYSKARRTFYPFPSARAYRERDVRGRHLDVVNMLTTPETLEFPRRTLERLLTTAKKAETKS